MADPSPDLPRLSVLTGSLAGKELVLEEVVDNILIGADPSCRFHIPLPGISPIHARIWMDAAGVTVYDTHSPRGLYVNDDRVNGQAPLRNGDILWLGTPGEDEAVMIQCRLPLRGAATATPVAAPALESVEPPPAQAPAASPEAEPDADATMAMGMPLVAEPEVAEPEALEVVEEEAEAEVPAARAELPNDLEAIEDSAGDATLVMAAPDEPIVDATHVEPDAEATMIAGPDNAHEIDTEATIVGGADAFYIHDDAAPPAPLPPVPVLSEMPEEDPVKFALDAPPLPVAPPPEPVHFEDETQDAGGFVPPPAPTVVEPPRSAPPPPRVVTPPPAPSAPKPVRPAAAPRPSTPAPVPVAAAAPSQTSAGGGGAKYAVLGLVGLLVLVGGGYMAFRMTQSQAPAEAPVAPATSVAAAAPPTAPPATLIATPPPTLAPEVPATTLPAPVEEVVTIVKSPTPGPSPSPGARPTPKPTPSVAPTPPPVNTEALRAQQTAAQVASLLGQADAAATARNYEGAAALYEEAVKLEPQNPRALEGRAASQGAAQSLRKSFVASKTTVKSEKTAKSPAGFDTDDVSVAKGLDYSGRIDFEVTPRNVKPGDSYNVLVYLTNDGKKSFKLSSVSVTTSVNGARSGGASPARVKELEPQQRVLLTESPGTWQGSTTGWSLEVTVQSQRGDTLRNVLTWK